MGILSSTCSQNKRISKHDPNSTLKQIRNSVSLDRDFYFKTSNNNNNNNEKSKYFSHSLESPKNSRGNSISSRMNSSLLINKTAASNKQNEANSKSNNRPKSVRNINIHLINSSDNLKKSNKSVSLSALDQIHIIITNIDLTSNTSSGVTPTKKILHDKIYSLVQLDQEQKQDSQSPKIESNTSSCSTKRRARKFSQLKTRKSYLLETKSQKTTSQVSLAKISRSNSNLSNSQQKVFKKLLYLN